MVPVIFNGFHNLGVIVVKVNWRDKTYTGSLMDMEQYPWATPKYVIYFTWNNQQQIVR